MVPAKPRTGSVMVPLASDSDLSQARLGRTRRPCLPVRLTAGLSLVYHHDSQRHHSKQT